MKINAKNLRDGIFNLNTRRFGTVAEILIKALIKTDWGKTQFHDLYDSNSQKRIEIKFSTVLENHKEPITEENIINSIINTNNENRMVSSNNYNDFIFDCNIQQVKKADFDILYYRLFFSDVVEIFKINSEDINEKLMYCDKQHKGNKGEGQFHINNKTYKLHKENYYFCSLSYQFILDSLQKN